MGEWMKKKEVWKLLGESHRKNSMYFCTWTERERERGWMRIGKSSSIVLDNHVEWIQMMNFPSFPILSSRISNKIFCSEVILLQRSIQTERESERGGQGVVASCTLIWVLFIPLFLPVLIRAFYRVRRRGREGFLFGQEFLPLCRLVFMSRIFLRYFSALKEWVSVPSKRCWCCME